MLEKNATVVFEEFAPWWVPEPNGRGTWGVLSSCIFTLSLCVFTAIHLHVGPQGQTTAEYLLHKCKWVAIAIVAPEVTLYSAGKQWFSAARLSKKLNGLAGQCEPDLKKIESKPFRSGSDTPSRAVPFVSPKRPNFGMMYGHFAVMGGFVVDVKHLHDGFNRLTITPKGVAFLARHGHFLPVSEATISDKSKANTLAKGLVCLQVLWMISQSISRKVVGLPLTLLEVHTLIHAACALAMYGLWFQKPLDVRDPTVIDASEFPDVLAMMLMRNYGFGNRLLVKNGEAPVPIHSTEYTYQNGSESSYLQMYGSPKNKEQQRDPLAQGIEIAPVQPSNPWQASQQNAAYNFMPSITTHRNSIGCDYALTPPHEARQHPGSKFVFQPPTFADGTLQPMRWKNRVNIYIRLKGP
ncbi:MAG: hypothetical protein M1827_006800 [Pycnora praestabilis]|nr:MAG: hypothetical protein M1827_006800 [Pycnora praestabilis]